MAPRSAWGPLLTIYAHYSLLQMPSAQKDLACPHTKQGRWAHDWQRPTREHRSKPHRPGGSDVHRPPLSSELSRHVRIVCAGRSQYHSRATTARCALYHHGQPNGVMQHQQLVARRPTSTGQRHCPRGGGGLSFVELLLNRGPPRIGEK